MNITIHLPVTTEEIWSAVSKAKERKDNPAPAVNILSDDTSTWLDDIEGRLKTARSDIFKNQALVHRLQRIKI